MSNTLVLSLLLIVCFVALASSDSNWVLCASEHQVCTFQTPPEWNQRVLVKYTNLGTQNKAHYKWVTKSSFTCNSAFFGSDPTPTLFKSCLYQTPYKSYDNSGQTRITEGTHYTFADDHLYLVRYLNPSWNANNLWFSWLYVQHSFDCTSEYFDHHYPEGATRVCDILWNDDHVFISPQFVNTIGQPNVLAVNNPSPTIVRFGSPDSGCGYRFLIVAGNSEIKCGYDNTNEVPTWWVPCWLGYKYCDYLPDTMAPFTPPIGYWKLVGSTRGAYSSSLSMQLTEGVESTQGSEYSLSDSHTLGISITKSAMPGGVGASGTINYEWTRQMTNTMSNSISQKREKSCTASCELPANSQDDLYMWQWQMSTSQPCHGDYQYCDLFIYSCHYACTTNNTEPCPLFWDC